MVCCGSSLSKYPLYCTYGWNWQKSIWILSSFLLVDLLRRWRIFSRSEKSSVEFAKEIPGDTLDINKVRGSNSVSIDVAMSQRIWLKHGHAFVQIFGAWKSLGWFSFFTMNLLKMLPPDSLLNDRESEGGPPCWLISLVLRLTKHLAVI